MKTNFRMTLLFSTVMAVMLAGCGNSDDSPTNAANVAGEGTPTAPSIPDTPGQATIVSKNVAVYGDVDKDKFSEIDLADGTSVLLLDDNTQDASYAAMGLSLPKLNTENPAASTLNYASEIYSSEPIQFNYADSVSNSAASASSGVSQMLQSQVDAYLDLIEKTLGNDGAGVNVLVNQTTLNSQSPVVQITLSVDYVNSPKSATYVRNVVLAAINQGALPQNVSTSMVDTGEKIRLDLSFWQDQNQVLLWTGANLAASSQAVAAKYKDLSTAAALTSSRATTTNKSAEAFTQTEGNSGGVDILWSIDASGSMGQEQDNLADGAEQFFNTLNAAGIDYRLAVNTQGRDSGRYHCKTLRETSTGNTFIDNSTVNALDEWRALARPGSSDSGTETGFYCVREVDLTSFDRPNAKNMVIFVSDEPENETFKRNRPSAADSSYTLQDFNSYKQYFKNTGATYFAISGPATVVRPAFDSNIASDPNDSCDGQGGSAYGGAHFKEIAKLTGGSAASICSDSEDWSVMFEQILETATGLASNFKLKYSPIPSTVKVTIDGKPVTRDIHHQNGFDLVYGQNDVSLSFYGESLPKQGGAINVEYDYLGNRIRQATP